MVNFRTTTLAIAVSSALALAASSTSADDDDVKPDQPTALAKPWHQPPGRLQAAGKVIDAGEQWGHCGPWVEDVDGDGVKDLLVGDFSGYFQYHRNEGSTKEPRYAKGVKLQAGGEDAKVPIY